MKFTTKEADQPTLVELRDCGNGVVMIVASKGAISQEIAQLSDGVLTRWRLSQPEAKALGLVLDDDYLIRIAQ